MLKVGDRLLCKKNTTNNNKYNKYELFLKNEYYIITIIDNVYVYVCHDWYKLDQNSIWYLWDFFYTPQEVRKLKLKQLNDDSR